MGLGILSAASGGERSWLVAMFAAIGAFVVVMVVDQAQATTTPGSGGSWGPPPPTPPAPPPAPSPDPAPPRFATPTPSEAPSAAAAAPAESARASALGDVPPIATPAPPISFGAASSVALPRVSGFARASLWCAVAGLVCIAILYALAVPYFLGVGR